MGRGGRIVNVGSRGAIRGEPEHTAYGAAKAGLTSFGQSLARELGPRGIAVMTVAPGFVQTDMAAEYLEGPEGDSIRAQSRSEEHTSELQSRQYLVCRLLLEK